MTNRDDIVFFCNFCGQKISLHESREGTTVECPACHVYIPVPRREDIGPAPAKHPVPNNTRRITVRMRALPGETQPHAPVTAAVPPASSSKSNGGVPPRNGRWLVIPILAGLLLIIGALVIIQRPQKAPSSGTIARLPVVDEKRPNIPVPAGPEERVESKTPPPAGSADTGPGTHAERSNLLSNGSLSGTGFAPDGWSSWNNETHDADKSTYRSAGNSWVFWLGGGIYQDVPSAISRDGPLTFGGYLYTPTADALRDGTKHGVLLLEFYNGDTLISTHPASPTVSADSPKDTWVFTQGTATVPANATKARVVVRCNDATSGDGVFRVDDVFLSKY
jgi:hypothetical protein